MVTQLVKNLPVMQETPVKFLGQEDPLEKGKATIPIFMGFLGVSYGKEPACNATCKLENLGSIPGLGRAPGGGHGNPLQHSYLENLHGQRSLAGYSSWGHKESDMTGQLSTT